MTSEYTVLMLHPAFLGALPQSPPGRGCPPRTPQNRPSYSVASLFSESQGRTAAVDSGEAVAYGTANLIVRQSDEVAADGKGAGHDRGVWGGRPLPSGSGQSPAFPPNPEASGDLLPTTPRSLNAYRVEDRRAVIGIGGVLMHESGVFDRAEAYGMFSTYARIRRDFDAAMADDDVDELWLHIDSPGGVVSGCFDLVDYIYQSRGVKPIHAVVDEHAYSAAYAIASAADDIVLPRTGGVGSIGVITTHIDYSRMLDRAGLTVTTLMAGNRKDMFSPTRPMTEDEKAEIQAELDGIYSIFTATVARNRGIGEQAVRDTEAGVFHGEDAVAIGLADRVSPVIDSFHQPSTHQPEGGSMSTEKAKGRKRSGLLALLLGPGDEDDAMSTDDVESLCAWLETEKEEVVRQEREHAEAAMKALKAEHVNDKAAAVQSAKEEVMGSQKAIFEACKTIGREDLAGQFMAEGMDLETARTALAEAMNAEDRKTPVVSAVAVTDGDSTPKVSPAILKINSRMRQHYNLHHGGNPNGQ